MSKKKEDIIEYKIITLGDSGVGKTAIFLRYAENKFYEDIISTIGMSFLDKIITKNGIKIKLKLVDTAGQERFRSIVKAYYKNADGVLFVFSLNDPQTFENIENWIKDFEQNVAKQDIPKFLVGNKNDLENNIGKEILDDFINKNNVLKYISTSAKNNTNIKELFEEMVEYLYKSNDKTGPQNIKKLQTNKKKKKNCCFGPDLYLNNK